MGKCNSMYINSISELDQLLNYEKKIEQEKNIDITNVSYWNASPEYQNYMLKNILLKNDTNIFNYFYTYDISEHVRRQILEKLTGKANTDSMCMITPSSTISIVNLINFLKLNNYRKLCIITPSYFSVIQSCEILNLAYRTIPLSYYNDSYIIPQHQILQEEFDAVWLTVPIYSTGIQYSQSQINVIREIMDKNILVIADETLAFPGQELSRIIPISKYFYSICSPHKPLFINSIKFSALLCPYENNELLDQWVDVLGGGLLHSNITAISHFVSSNYEYCVQKSSNWYQKNLSTIKNLLELFPNAYCNTSEVAPYKTIYIKHAPDSFSDRKNLIKENYVSYISNTYNGFDPKNGLSFRVNMSIPANKLQDYLYRILKYYA